MNNRSETLKKDLRKKPRDPMILRNLARLFLQEKKYKEARAKYRLVYLYNQRLITDILLDFEKTLEMNPSDISLRLLISDMLLYTGDLESAIGELEEVLELDPKKTEVYNVLGRLYLKRQDPDMLIGLLEKALKLGINDVSLTEMLAGTYIEKERIDDAIALYKNLIELNPTNRNYYRVLGELCERKSLFDDASKSYINMLDESTGFIAEVIHKLKGLTEKAPENIFVKEKLTDVYVKGIKPDLAIEECRKILELEPGKIDSMIAKYQEILSLYPDEPHTLLALGDALIVKGEYTSAAERFNGLTKYHYEYLDNAIEGYKNILEKYADHSLAHEFLGDAYVKKDMIEVALNEYIHTIKLDSTSGKSIVNKCQEIIKTNPNMILAHHVLGEAYVACGEYDIAIEEADFIIYLDKNYAPAYVILGDSNLGLDNVLKAIESYNVALKLDPFNTSIHEKNKKAHMISFDGEIKTLKRKIEEDPWRVGLHLDLAKVYILKSDFDKGIKELQLAVKDNARAPFAYNTLGQTFMEEGRFDLGIIQFEKSIDITPNELSDFVKVVRFNLGSSHEAIGEAERAISEYEKILQEDVGFGALQARIKNLSTCGANSLRNKSISAVIAQLGEKKIIGQWGIDFRVKEVTRDVLNISFGQDHNTFGYEHFIKGRYSAAEEEFELAIQLDSDFYSALNNLAVMYIKTGKIEQAETRLNLALSVEPNFAVIYNNLGVLSYLSGNYKVAAEKLEKALEINPYISSAYINLGDVYYLQGKCEQALSLWKKIRDFDPLSPLARRRLAFRVIE